MPNDFVAVALVAVSAIAPSLVCTRTSDASARPSVFLPDLACRLPAANRAR
jgi:hypothetical protein